MAVFNYTLPKLDLNLQLPVSSQILKGETINNLQSFDSWKESINNTVIGGQNHYLGTKNGSSVEQPKQEQTQTDQQQTGSGAVRTVTSQIIDAGANQLSNQVVNMMGDSEIARNLGTIFSSGISSTGKTISDNIIKGQALTTGLGRNVGASVAGTAAGVAANYIGKGINSLGGNSMLSRGIGQGVATGLGTVGGTVLSNLIKYKNVAGNAEKLFGTAGKGWKMFGTGKGAINPYALGAQVIGTGLQAAFGPSKEYGGKYGNITKTMDSVYDTIQMGVGFIPGYGQAISAAMALNKGLSNIFGSTDGMTRQDAILGSAFMPAPVKWLNMAGASSTGNFNNQSWQNTERANSFMGNAFGNLNERFDKAREEAGKTYGTFSSGARNRAQNNINFANQAWGQIMAMADQNEIQNIRSQYMTSINNQRYAQDIGGAWQPIYRGKQGMKIFNNATNHNIGMRLLS